MKTIDKLAGIDGWNMELPETVLDLLPNFVSDVPAICIYPRMRHITLKPEFGSQPGAQVPSGIKSGTVLRHFLTGGLPDPDAIESFLTGKKGRTLLARLLHGYEEKYQNGHAKGTLDEDAAEAVAKLFAALDGMTTTPEAEGLVEASAWVKARTYYLWPDGTPFMQADGRTIAAQVTRPLAQGGDMIIVADTTNTQLGIWADWLDRAARDEGKLLRGSLAFLEGLRSKLS